MHAWWSRNQNIDLLWDFFVVYYACRCVARIILLGHRSSSFCPGHSWRYLTGFNKKIKPNVDKMTPYVALPINSRNLHFFHFCSTFFLMEVTSVHSVFLYTSDGTTSKREFGIQKRFPVQRKGRPRYATQEKVACNTAPSFRKIYFSELAVSEDFEVARISYDVHLTSLALCESYKKK